jgi:hypothetical protein
LGFHAKIALSIHNLSRPLARIIQFDDLETFEHTKYKPVSVTLAVEETTRRILAVAVSQMPAKGRLVKKSVQKYGARKDQRSKGRRRLFETLKPLIEPKSIIKSDQNPHYIKDVKRHFPEARHVPFKGQRGANTGQGELKKVEYDPLFSLNHTCAKLRADICRLIRKTWSTTKLKERLELHLLLYAVYHNLSLLAPKRV